MKLNEIHVRDPFVLPWEGTYYMYGTRGETAFSKQAYGFDVYVSRDLTGWESPREVFHRPDGFWADHNYWAPEVHVYQGRFYMFATFASGKNRLGTAVLRADSPLGPFLPWSKETLTPADWRCLDGTLYVDQSGVPYLVFSREWKQVHDGQICAVKLSDDLSGPAGEPFVLFRASAGRPAIRPFLFKNYVTDGPFLLRTEDGRLHLLWSSFGKGGYVQAMAHSDNDEIDGRWTVDQKLLFEKDGGHGMIFRTFDSKWLLVLHQPNRQPKERPVFRSLSYRNGAFTATEWN